MVVKSIILDTNLLILLVVGTTDLNLIAKHKNCNSYTIDDFEALRLYLEKTKAIRIIVTPNTLTETSNLLAQTNELDKKRVLHRLKTFTKNKMFFYEDFITSSQAMDRDEFEQLGLTDSVLLELSNSEALLLTADNKLHSAALNKKYLAANFGYIKYEYLK